MRNYRRFAYLIILTTAAALILVLTAYKANQNSDRQARYRERDIREKAALELGKEVRDRIGMALRTQVTIDEFEKAFGPVTELTDVTDPKYAEMTHSYLHEKSQRMFYLRFQDGKLLGSKSNHGSGDVDTGIVLETPAFMMTEAVRSSVLLGGQILWCIALLSAIFSRRFRLNAAVILVVLSMACGLCWFLAPNYSPTVQGISSNDNLATFVFMLICSFGFFILARPLRNADGRERYRIPEQSAPVDALPRAAEPQR
jgi:hypothetical protein